MILKIFLFTVTVLCIFHSQSSAQSSNIPQVIAFQGFLSSADSGVTDNIPANFTLWDDSTSQNNIHEAWAQQTANIQVTKGYYTAWLDFSTGWLGQYAIDKKLFNKPFWIEVFINGKILDHRIRLAAAPYAFNAQIADSAIRATTATNFTGSLSGEVTGTQNTTFVSNAISVNTPNTIVKRDGSGNFTAGTITAKLTGNATTADTAFHTQIKIAYVHKWDSLNNGGSYTKLSYPNMASTDIVIVTHAIGIDGTGNQITTAVGASWRISSSRWEIFREDSSPTALIGEKFNVLVLKP